MQKFEPSFLESLFEFLESSLGGKLGIGRIEDLRHKFEVVLLKSAKLLKGCSTLEIELEFLKTVLPTN